MDENLTPVEQRIKKARSWPDRVSMLVGKGKKYKSEAALCRAHDFDAGFFNRVKNLKSVPTQKTVDKIEAVLSLEGV